MKIQLRIFLLLVVLVSGTAVFNLYLHREEKINLRAFLNNRLAEKDSTFDRIISLKTKELQIITCLEYSIWDEMVEYVHMASKQQADNIDVQKMNEFESSSINLLLNQYNFSGVWIYDTDFNFLYGRNTFLPNHQLELPLNDQQLLTAFNQSPEESSDHFAHFFLQYNNELIEVRGASIHGTLDNERRQIPSGYLLASKKWDRDFLHEIGNLNGATVSINFEAEELSTTQSRGNSDQSGSLLSERFYSSFDGSSVGKALIHYSTPYYLQIVANDEKSVIIFLAFSFLLIIIVSWAFLSWVNAPLYRIATSLKTENADSLSKLAAQSNEFGILAKLIVQFFRQKKYLQLEIHARKNSEAALRISEKRFVDVTRAAGEFIWEADESKSITYISEKIFDTAGYLPEECIGKNFEGIIASSDLEQINRLYDSPDLKENGFKNLEFRFIRKDNSVGYMKVSGTAILDESRKVRGYRGTGLDITKDKEFQEDLRQAKEIAESVNLQKSEFLANMSHEIRTPMNGIIGMTEIVLNTELNAEQREYLELAKTSADNLLTVINDILDFSKIEAGKLEIEFIEFDLRDVISKTMKLMALRKHSEQIEVMLDIDPSIPEILIGDPARIRQIIINLVGNALKFTERGEVSFKARLNSLTDGKASIDFFVSDTGIGIPEHKQEKIFESFTQADGATSRKYGGTGLGLSITQKLILMMGGEISLQSKINSGSCFKFNINFNISTAGPVNTRINFKLLSTLKILIVDNHHTNRMILHTQLNHLVKEIQLAEGGNEALIKMKVAREMNEPFHIVLLDVQMPEMDGWEVADKMNSEQLSRVTRICIMSSVADSIDAGTRARFNISGFLAKPAIASELLRELICIMEPTIPDSLVKCNHKLPEIRLNPSELNILLAEDDLINQKLAEAIFAKNGYTLKVVNNGVELIEEYLATEYDIIFMDIQMPLLDGYETTRRIRAIEKNCARHTPIVAITAHAMNAHRQNCLNAGMDYYISKPIVSSEIFYAIEMLLNTQTSRRHSASKGIGNENAMLQTDILNLNFFKEQCTYEVSLMKEIAELFIAELNENIDYISEANQHKEARALQFHAHKMKGSVAPFGAKKTAQHLAELEKLAKEKDWAGIVSTYPIAIQSMRDLARELSIFISLPESLLA